MLGRAVTSLRLRAADALDAALGRRDPFIPPRRLNLAGSADFRLTGEELRRHLTTLAQLAPSDRVLDIGCGLGRIARVLRSVLAAPDGSYDGFDVSRAGIDWCRKRYRDTAVPFRFRYVDVHHPHYHPSAGHDPAAFRFPYPDESFDLAIAVSVFTHLLDASVEHYLAETRRVLAPGGRLLATWFVLDPRRPIQPAMARLRFAHATGEAARIERPEEPEYAVAYGSDWVLGHLRDAGLLPREPVAYGSWTGLPGLSAQDIVVADRVESRPRLTGRA